MVFIEHSVDCDDIKFTVFVRFLAFKPQNVLVWLLFPEDVDRHSEIFDSNVTSRHLFLLNHLLMLHFELFKCVVNSLLQTFNFNFISPNIYLLDLLIRCTNLFLFFLILFLDNAIDQLCLNIFGCFNRSVSDLFGVKDSDFSDANFCFGIFTGFVESNHEVLFIFSDLFSVRASTPNGLSFSYD